LPKLLKDLQINDVSSVDRGAGRGVKVMLMKRDAEAEKRKADLQKFNTESDKAKSAANVIDMRGLLRKDAVDFETASANGEAQETASDIVNEMDECICALRCAIGSILDDPEVNDKAAAIEESFKQFQDYIAGLDPANVEKAMTTADIKKQIDDAVAAALKDTTEKLAALETTNKALTDENVVLKMSDKHKAFHSGLDSKEAKDKFAAMSGAERDAHMEKTKKSIDPDIAKRLADADADRVLLKALVEKDEIATFAKRAAELGLPVEHGELLRKAHRGDAEAFKSVEAIIGTMNKALREAQTTGKIFKEFGAQGEKGGTSALDELNAKAEEYRKTEAGKSLTQQQAFAKVYNDPANAEVAKREKQERNKSMGVAA
jgi:hypothetical protein